MDIIGDADPQRYDERHATSCSRTTAADARPGHELPDGAGIEHAVAEDVVGALNGRARARASPASRCSTSWLGDGASQWAAGDVRGEAQIASFATPTEAIEGFMQLVRYRRAQDELMRTPPSASEAMSGSIRRR